MTSSSVVGEKSQYHSPTAKNRSGVLRQTNSSTSRASSATVDGDATGTARTTRAAPRARATWQATRAVEPVAMPSSTTTAVRPSSETRRATVPVPTLPPLKLRSLPLRDSRELGPVDPDQRQNVEVEDLGPLFADGPHGQLGLEGHSQFAYHDHIERRPEHRGDLEADRHPSPWEPKHHDFGGLKGQQPLAEAAPGVETVVEH